MACSFDRLAWIVWAAVVLAAPLLVLAHGSGRDSAVQHRNAPDDQAAPLEEGTVPDIPPDERLLLDAQVVDADTGQPLPHRVRILDSAGGYYPPSGHVNIGNPRWLSSNVSVEPDVSNRGRAWAMIPQGRFTATLRAADGYTVLIEHGLEYERAAFKLDLAGQAGATVAQTFRMKRGINMREKGWMSADTHVHNLTPTGAIRQMPVEAIDYVNLMFIGPGHPLRRRGWVTGQANPVSTKDYIVYVSQEVRDAHQGHMTLLGMSRPIMPIAARAGREIDPAIPPLPNEPLNWEVYDMMHAQNGLAFHAHYLFWPGYSSAATAALGKIDGFEWLCPDIVKRGPQTRQNIQVPGFALTGGGRMWYDMLNCGARIPLIGGTDKMSATRVLGCTDRTYAQVKTWDHPGFMDALRNGRTFATNGPLLNLTANGQDIGSTLKFTGDGPFEVQVETGCFTQRPIAYLEVVQDGEVVHHVAVKGGQKEVKVSLKLSFTRSGWLAVRAGAEKPDPENWENTITAAHSSPIYVTVNGELPAVKASAEYLVARCGVATEWARNEALWSSDEYKARAVAGFTKAQDFYKAALARAIAREPKE